MDDNTGSTRCGVVRHSTLWLEPVLVAQFEYVEWTPDTHLRHLVTGGGFGNWDQAAIEVSHHPCERTFNRSPCTSACPRNAVRRCARVAQRFRVREELTEDLKQLFLRYPGKDWGQLRGEERSQRRRALTLLLSSFCSASLQ